MQAHPGAVAARLAADPAQDGAGGRGGPQAVDLVEGPELVEQAAEALAEGVVVRVLDRGGGDEGATVAGAQEVERQQLVLGVGDVAERGALPGGPQHRTVGVGVERRGGGAKGIGDVRLPEEDRDARGPGHRREHLGQLAGRRRAGARHRAVRAAREGDVGGEVERGDHRPPPRPRGRDGVLGEEQHDVARRLPHQQVPGATVAELSRRDADDPRTGGLGGAVRAVRRPGVDDDELGGRPVLVRECGEDVHEPGPAVLHRDRDRRGPHGISPAGRPGGRRGRTTRPARC